MYRIPRQPSSPRIAVWRKLRALGAGQLVDGVAALPEDARTREHLEWVADQVLEAGGTSLLLRAQAVARTDGQAIAFETILRRHDLLDPALWRIAAIVHEADLEYDRYDAPEAPSCDVVLRGLSMTQDDNSVIALTAPMFDGLYDYYRRSLILGKGTPT